MKFALLLATVALTGLSAAAHATVYNVSLTGTVASTSGVTGYATGSTVTGAFTLFGSSDIFTAFTIGGRSAPTGGASSAVINPARTDAIYQTQVSPVQQGGTTNSTFSLDLSSLTTWAAGDTADTLLTDAAQLTGNLDTAANPASAFPSTFDYYTANANGTGVASLTANLSTITVSAVPEPASMVLLATSVIGLGFAARRR